jgi:hypothetical protein
MWHVQINGHEHKLGWDKTEAWRLYHELMGKTPEERPHVRPAEMEAVEILDLFLDWCRKNRAAATYDWHLRFCQKPTATLPPALPVTELKPYHLTKVMDAEEWSKNTKSLSQ